MVVFVVPAAQTVPEALVVFPGVVDVPDASLFFVVGDVALVLAAAAQEFEIALFDFVALSAVVVAAQEPLCMSQAAAWQLPYAHHQDELISMFLCLTVALSVYFEKVPE